jgi:hypothetical protein
MQATDSTITNYHEKFTPHIDQQTKIRPLSTASCMVFEPLTELGNLASVVGKCAQYRSKQLQNLFQNGCTVQLKKPIGTLTDYRIVSIWYWAGQHKSNEHKKLTKAKGVAISRGGRQRNHHGNLWHE